MAKVLLIEGNQYLRVAMTQTLGDAGFDVVTASDSTLGVMAAYEACPDMVLLDEELPPVNGEELCSYISRIFAIPVIVLVSNEQGLDSARFLEMGADACLVKPLEQRMLLARVSSLLRRCKMNPEYRLPLGMELDAIEQRVSIGDRMVDLTPTEFRLLNCLALNSGRLVSYPELAIGGWGREEITPGNLKFYLSCLKNKLANGSDPDFNLVNERGFGFRFVPSGEC